jgi:hypothetical protein
MNKIVWEECKNPYEMIVAVCQRFPVLDTKLKLIFFAVSWCSRLLPFLKDERSKKVLEFMVQYEDTRPFRRELRNIRNESLAVLQEEGIDWKNALELKFSVDILAAIAVYHLSSFVTISDALVFCNKAITDNDDEKIKQELAEQADLLREIFGNPFQVHKETMILGKVKPK